MNTVCTHFFTCVDSRGKRAIPVRLLPDTAPRSKDSDGLGSRAAYGFPPKQASAAHSRSAASRHSTRSYGSPDAGLQAGTFYTGRTWHNMRMILKENPKAHAIMGGAMRVHSILGHGFLESE